ncbi:hypothetical protein GBO14_14825 [Pseudoalteromonas shioyasakiensis]|uniref:hypothetical protein n=1 Tax=Pseudoalteromonas shioyasakiensis TaxID=1190813 RepID=UPI002094643D|nr:hypothetical protein [Pseudoalteromonas shioyasakiensis]MCO6355993.1 hypothetical protein [Pseudoalteromonas shioyasakiensis]
MYELYFQSDFSGTRPGLYFSLVCSVLLILCCPNIKYWYENKLKFEKKVNFWFGFLFVFGFFVMQSLSFYGLVLKSNDIDSGNYSTVEGTIEDIQIVERNSREEAFTVDGVRFKYNDYGTENTFFANRKHDSDTIQEGRVVKIAYLRGGNENLIFELSVRK